MVMATSMRGCRRDAEAELNLPPGFRFHPTDDELVVHYLCRKMACQRLPVPIIAEVDLYKFDPWDLPEKALFGQKEWYFFTPRDRKYPNGSRPNRTAGRGYWKATGADKPVRPDGRGRPLGIKKALVFYHGKAPRGVKTDWIMHEYRLVDAGAGRAATKKGTLRLDDWVLCRLYNKKNSREKSVAGTRGTAAAVEPSHDTASEGFATQESDIEHDEFVEFGSLAGQTSSCTQTSTAAAAAAAANPGQFQMVHKQEEGDWFVDLNLDDLQMQSSLMAFGSVPNLDAPNQDYFFQNPSF